MRFIWINYTNIRADYWEKIHLMSFLLITKRIPTGMDIEKITLLRWECRKRFKVTLLSSRILWLVVDASIRGPIYLFNKLITTSYLFQNTYNIFCKNTIFRKYIFY